MKNNKIIFLLPPSEGKNTGWDYTSQQLEFVFEKPVEITRGVTPKDLHCKDKRFEQAQVLNSQTLSGQSDYQKAIHRYSGVMYNAIDYAGMSSAGQQFFEENFLVISGMYGLVRPTDIIWNYKLPIGAKWLYKFWWDTLTKALWNIQADVVVNMLPQAYAKAIDFDAIDSQIVHIAFMKYKDETLVNMAHGVKKVKGEWIKNVCENAIADYTQFKWEVLENNTHQTTVRIIQPLSQ